MVLSKKIRWFLMSENCILKWELENGNALIWVKESELKGKEQETYGEYHSWFEKSCGYQDTFFKYCRMSIILTFDIIVNWVKKNQYDKKFISPKERLVVIWSP